MRRVQPQIDGFILGGPQKDTMDKDMKSKNESSEIITSMSCDDEKVLTQSELRTHKRRMTEYAKQLYRKKNNAVVEGLTKAIGSNDFVVLQQNDDQEEWSLKTIVNVEITYENEPRIEVDWKLENVSFETCFIPRSFLEKEPERKNNEVDKNGN